MRPRRHANPSAGKPAVARFDSNDARRRCLFRFANSQSGTDKSARIALPVGRAFFGCASDLPVVAGLAPAIHAAPFQRRRRHRRGRLRRPINAELSTRSARPHGLDAPNHVDDLDKPGHDAFGTALLVCPIPIPQLPMPNAREPTMSCRKTEVRLSWPHEQFCAFLYQSWGGHSGAAHSRRQSDRKIFPAKFPHNPLISHDSDERIQGNPRKSNSDFRWFS